MAKRSLIEQLDDAVEAIMARPDAPRPPLDPRVAELLQIAADLRDLPTAAFKARLKADLQRGAVASAVKAVPEGYHTATPCLIIRDAPSAIEFYKRAFGATELLRHADPSGKIMHAEIKIGDSAIAIADEAEDWGNFSPQSLGGSPVIMSLYVEDVDGLATQAVAAGAKVIFPVADQFYGDRSGRLADPFGHIWIVASHKEDVSPEELQRRVDAWTREQQEPAAIPSEPIAAGSYRVEPYLPVRDASRLIEFLKLAFGAEETSRHTRPDGTVAHADVRIGDSVVATGDSTDLAPAPTALHLYVPDADAVYQRALSAGATSTQAPVDQDYGDREAGVQDPFGNYWYIATHKQDVAETPSRAASYIPEGLGNMTPYLHPQGAPRLIDFLKQAFAAEEAFSARAPDGTIVHAKIRIGESVVEMGEAHGPYQPMPTIFHLYVTDTDTVYRRAVAAGGVSLSQPANQPWGYRSAGVQDPGGNQWWINAPIETPTPESQESTSAEAKEATMAVTPEAPSWRTVTPFLQVRNVGSTLDFLRQAFGAEVIVFDRGGDPPHDHAEVRIGDSLMMMGEAIPGFEPTSSAFYLSVDDCDAMYERAVKAGLTSMEAPKERPWGDRMAHVKDVLGNSWYISAHKK